MKKIILGTRGSQLALIQTEIIQHKLQSIAPNLQTEIKIIKTTGDKNMSPVPLDSVGKGWFTKEIDKALLNGSIDIAVHSLKDLSEELPSGLVIAAVPEREDAREALVSYKNKPFSKLKKGAIVGTDSARRRVQILQKRPDLNVESVRGNVNRRLEKLDNGDYDALFLAVAGLKRLGFEKRIAENFSVNDVIPSPGQGALAVVSKKSNKTLLSLLKKLNHQNTVTAVSAERTFSKIVGGGCKMPVGVYAECTGKTITLFGMLGSLDSKHLVKDSISGKTADAEKLAKTLAERLMKAASSWFSRDLEKYIVITRPAEENYKLQKQLEKEGHHVLSFPCIEIKKQPVTEKIKTELNNLASYDWIIFTSRNGVRFFMDTLSELHIDPKILSKKYIAAVGDKTAEEAKKYNLQIQFIPSQFTTENLGKELKNAKGKKVLLPRANIATPFLIRQLKDKGALVTNISIYKTVIANTPSNDFEKLLASDAIQCIIFTSPSTVDGFLKNVKKLKNAVKIFALPVLAIGPVTAKALKKNGFSNITTAETYTAEGIFDKIKINVL